MTSVGVTKAKALSYMARYYGVPIKNTIAIGDGYNDVSMFETAEFSVAMHQASEDIKSIATYVSRCSNKDCGVAEFINKFLDDKNDKFKDQLREARKLKRHIVNKTNKAHH